MWVRGILEFWGGEGGGRSGEVVLFLCLVCRVSIVCRVVGLGKGVWFRRVKVGRVDFVWFYGGGFGFWEGGVGLVILISVFFDLVVELEVRLWVLVFFFIRFCFFLRFF